MSTTFAVNKLLVIEKWRKAQGAGRREKGWEASGYVKLRRDKTP